jgi:hypothetical protein
MLFVLMLVVAVLAIPSAVAAGSIAQDCTFEKVKWQDNPSSWYLYLNNWGRTPPNAMSRLAGLKITAFGHTLNKNAECGTAAVSTCADCAQAGGLWGVSTCFANKSWASDDIGTLARINNDHPNHRGCAKCDPKLTGKGEPCGSLVCANGPCKACSGGDWGVTGCAHPQCVGDTWCYTDNLATGKGANCPCAK